MTRKAQGKCFSSFHRLSNTTIMFRCLCIAIGFAGKRKDCIDFNECCIGPNLNVSTLVDGLCSRFNIKANMRVFFKKEGSKQTTNKLTNKTCWFIFHSSWARGEDNSWWHRWGAQCRGECTASLPLPPLQTHISDFCVECAPKILLEQPSRKPQGKSCNVFSRIAVPGFPFACLGMLSRNTSRRQPLKALSWSRCFLIHDSLFSCCSILTGVLFWFG